MIVVVGFTVFWVLVCIALSLLHLTARLLSVLTVLLILILHDHDGSVLMVSAYSEFRIVKGVANPNPNLIMKMNI